MWCRGSFGGAPTYLGGASPKYPIVIKYLGGSQIEGGPPKFEICIILLGSTMSGGPPLICLHTLCKMGGASPDFVTNGTGMVVI